MQDQSPHKRAFESMLSNDIRAFLKPYGYRKNGHRFYRRREPLYDQFHFQGSVYNGVRPFGFFVNIDVGSTEFDAISPSRFGATTPPSSFLLDHRWQYLAPGLPSEVRFTSPTDIPDVATEVCRGLARVIAEFDKLDSTDALVQFMVARTKLLAYERVTRYLSATHDIDTLRRYVTTLRDTFGHESRWSIFNSKLIDAADAAAPTLIADGLLTSPPS